MTHNCNPLDGMNIKYDNDKMIVFILSTSVCNSAYCENNIH